MAGPLSITASYAFIALDKERLPAIRQELLAFGREWELRGLVLIAEEGINSTVSGSAASVAEWKTYLAERFGMAVFKDSASKNHVFKRWSVRIKPEIVGIKDGSFTPRGRHRHLSPDEWQKMLSRDDVIVVDARNSYEYSIGKFRGAVDPGTGAFHQFPEYAKKAELPKDKKILLYCTGGIRCEKAILALEREGYDDVHQLEGGILAYLEKFPRENFEGECFVFDKRVAVDQDLRPSSLYGLCPHCGHAGDRTIMCACGMEQKICADCEKDEYRKTCSKRCRNERKKGSKTLARA